MSAFSLWIAATVTPAATIQMEGLTAHVIQDSKEMESNVWVSEQEIFKYPLNCFVAILCMPHKPHLTTHTLHHTRCMPTLFLAQTQECNLINIDNGNVNIYRYQ